MGRCPCWKENVEGHCGVMGKDLMGRRRQCGFITYLVIEVDDEKSIKS